MKAHTKDCSVFDQINVRPCNCGYEVEYQRRVIQGYVTAADKQTATIAALRSQISDYQDACTQKQEIIDSHKGVEAAYREELEAARRELAKQHCEHKAPNGTLYCCICELDMAACREATLTIDLAAANRRAEQMLAAFNCSAGYSHYCPNCGRNPGEEFLDTARQGEA